MAALGLCYCASFLLLRCLGFSLRWCPLLQNNRLSSCDMQAQLLRSMWNLLRPGIKPMSPALAGILSTTGPPGKSLLIPFFRKRNGGSGRLCDLSRGREEEFKHKFDENYKPHFCLDAGEHENLQGYSVITLCAFTFLLRKHFYRKTPALSELN